MYLPAGSCLEIPGRSSLFTSHCEEVTFYLPCKEPVLNYDGYKNHPRDDFVEENNGELNVSNELKLRERYRYLYGRRKSCTCCDANISAEDLTAQFIAYTSQ